MKLKFSLDNINYEYELNLPEKYNLVNEDCLTEEILENMNIEKTCDIGFNFEPVLKMDDNIKYILYDYNNPDYFLKTSTKNFEESKKDFVKYILYDYDDQNYVDYTMVDVKTFETKTLNVTVRKDIDIEVI